MTRAVRSAGAQGGVEPPRPYGHTDLNRARLPIPPLAHTDSHTGANQPTETNIPARAVSHRADGTTAVLHVLPLHTTPSPRHRLRVAPCPRAAPDSGHSLDYRHRRPTVSPNRKDRRDLPSRRHRREHVRTARLPRRGRPGRRPRMAVRPRRRADAHRGRAHARVGAAVRAVPRGPRREALLGCRLLRVHRRQAPLRRRPVPAREPRHPLARGRGDGCRDGETVHGLGNRKNEAFNETLAEEVAPYPASVACSMRSSGPAARSPWCPARRTRPRCSRPPGSPTGSRSWSTARSLLATASRASPPPTCSCGPPSCSASAGRVRGHRRRGVGRQGRCDRAVRARDRRRPRSGPRGPCRARGRRDRRRARRVDPALERAGAASAPTTDPASPRTQTTGEDRA